MVPQIRVKSALECQEGVLSRPCLMMLTLDLLHLAKSPKWRKQTSRIVALEWPDICHPFFDDFPNLCRLCQLTSLESWRSNERVKTMLKDRKPPGLDKDHIRVCPDSCLFFAGLI